MNKTTKAIVSSTLAIGTVFGIGTSIDQPQNSQAHAATTPYYTYKGYVNNDGSFLLSKSFKNAVKYGNVTFNGTKIVPQSYAKTDKTNDFNKYDQFFSSMKSGKQTASSVKVNVNNVTVKQLKSVYGDALVEDGTALGKDPNTDSYRLTGSKESPYHTPVTFVQKDGKVQSAIIGYEGSGA